MVLTAERLRELLDYNPLTGQFSWRPLRPRGIQKAGTKDARGYWRICVDGVIYQAHRLAWLHVHGHWPIYEIDHRDRDPSNNRIANLRDVPKLLNARNKARRSLRRTLHEAKWTDHSSADLAQSP